MSKRHRNISGNLNTLLSKLYFIQYVSKQYVFKHLFQMSIITYQAWNGYIWTYEFQLLISNGFLQYLEKYKCLKVKFYIFIYF